MNHPVRGSWGAAQPLLTVGHLNDISTEKGKMRTSDLVVVLFLGWRLKSNTYSPAVWYLFFPPEKMRGGN